MNGHTVKIGLPIIPVCENQSLLIGDLNHGIVDVLEAWEAAAYA
jgi:hypothetical protein